MNQDETDARDDRNNCFEKDSPFEPSRTEQFDDEPRLVTSDEPQSSLSWPLRILFSFNGATLSLPSTALMYIVNTRAAVPLAYLSVYGAVAFLPASLKPLYAFLSGIVSRRDMLISALLLLSGISIAATALIPSGGVASCFLLAFLREFFSAWPEFLLGVTLLEQAQATKNFDKSAALFQSQAATARNIGSLFASVVGFLFFLHRHFFEPGKELTDLAVNVVLVVTGSINLFGAIYAFIQSVGSNRACYRRLDNVSQLDDDPSSEVTPTRHWKPSGIFLGDATLVVLLQMLVMLFALRQPFIDAVSVMTWNIVLLLLSVAMLFTLGCNYFKWNRAHQVGLFLVVKHAMPSSEYILDSFVYSLFQSSPMILQLFGIIGMGVTTISSWSYGRILSSYSSGTKFLAVIAGTTICAALFSLCNIAIVGLEGKNSSWLVFATVLIVSVFTTFSGEWSFLPSIILATTAVNVDDKPRINSLSQPFDEERPSPHMNSYQQMKVSFCECQKDDILASTGMKYGTLVSCIDFGDQVGSWLTVPLVAALGISRDNDWAHLDTFIVVTTFLSLVPLGLLPILKERN